MATSLGLFGIPRTSPSGAISVIVMAGVSIAVYSALSPSVQCKANIIPSECVSVYSVQQPAVSENVIVLPDACNAFYSIPNHTVKASSNVFSDECTANYSVNDVSVIESSTVHPDVCSAIYSGNSADISGDANIFVDACVAIYSVQQPTILENEIVVPDQCSAVYSINVPIIIGAAEVFPDLCISVYSIISPKILENEVVLPDVCTAAYSLYTPVVNATAIIFPDFCHAIYSVHQPTILENEIVFPDPCIAVYSVIAPLVGTTVRPSSVILEFYVSPYYTVNAGGIPNYRDISKMPTVWLRKCNGHDYENERRLYRKVLTESYNKFGVCMTYYMVSYDTQYDRIWGEDNDRRFIRKFDVMCYFPLQTEEKLWTKFSIEGQDNFSMFCSKDHFRAACTYGQQQVRGNIGKNTYSTYVPKTGDVIQSKYNSYLYEILTVKEESMMMHLNKKYTWELIVKPYLNESISLDTDTSASMGSVSANTGGIDIFDISQDAISAAVPVNYDPKSCERDPQLPYFGW